MLHHPAKQRQSGAHKAVLHFKPGALMQANAQQAIPPAQARRPAHRAGKRLLAAGEAGKLRPVVSDLSGEGQIGQELLADSGTPEPQDEVRQRMADKLARMQREGRFPIGQLALRLQDELVEELAPVRLAWLALDQRLPRSADKVTGVPSWSGRVKSGATVPGARRVVVIVPPYPGDAR